MSKTGTFHGTVIEKYPNISGQDMLFARFEDI